MTTVAWIFRAWFALVLGLALAGPAAAQYRNGDQGQYQILNARYGTAAHNMDVTQRLKELSSRDDRFQVTNNLFGGDPEIGAHKSLRIYARDTSGATRMFEITEGGIVNGADFIGWRGGNWGGGYGNGGWEGPAAGTGYGPGQGGGGADRGQYTILNARYGTQRHNMDVTQRLKALASRDDRFRVTNDQFGGDPDVGAHKALRIYSRDANGNTRMFEITEGGIVNGADFVGWRNGNWGRERYNGGWGGVAR